MRFRNKVSGVSRASYALRLVRVFAGTEYPISNTQYPRNKAGEERELKDEEPAILIPHTLGHWIFRVGHWVLKFNALCKYSETRGQGSGSRRCEKRCPKLLHVTICRSATYEALYQHVVKAAPLKGLYLVAVSYGNFETTHRGNRVSSRQS